MNSNSQLYGKGVFSTVAVRDGEPLLWEKHWRRLRSNANRLAIPLHEVDEHEVLRRLTSEIQGFPIGIRRARITLLDDTPSEIWPGRSEPGPETSVHILLGYQRTIPDTFTLTTSPFPVNSLSPLAGVKSCNYLDQVLSLDEAKNRGFHEAIRVNEKGFVASACMANLFWVKDSELLTPGLETGCLAGTTREFVLENFGCSEVEAEIGELDGAEAIFLTSAGIGIARVADFDGRALADVSHPIMNLWPSG